MQNDTHREAFQALDDAINRAVIGQEHVVRTLLLSLLTNGNVLLEGLPGTAKTRSVKTLARCLDVTLGRIQFTPDLLPSDVTGTEVYYTEGGTGSFKFQPGPIFNNIILADEINRAPAKTQSALLQAMQERMVTIDRKTHTLSPNFTVFATQNPIEYEGTYPLPEAQKDRFMLKISMDHPGRDEELSLARRMLGKEAPEKVLVSGQVKQIITPEILAKLRESLEEILVKEELSGYIVDIVRQTRRHPSVLVGAGPRATQSLILAGRTHAAINGRDFITPDDIKTMALPVLEHRLILRPEYEIEGLTVDEVIVDVERAGAEMDSLCTGRLIVGN